ncbi:MAG: choice-of-anchor D domain-containing protein [Bacteroidales bacterium]|nr:choice-of-anchor D domain-containing protein [Bacteroidales bacterium]
MRKPYAILAGILSLGAVTLLAQHPLGEKLSDWGKGKKEQVSQDNNGHKWKDPKDSNEPKEKKDRFANKGNKSLKSLSVSGLKFYNADNLDLIAADCNEVAKKSVIAQNISADAVDFSAYVYSEASPTALRPSICVHPAFAVTVDSLYYLYSSSSYRYLTYDSEWNLVGEYEAYSVNRNQPSSMTAIDGNLWIFESGGTIAEYTTSFERTGREFNVPIYWGNITSMDGRIVVAEDSQNCNHLSVYNLDGSLYATLEMNESCYNPYQILYDKASSLFYLVDDGDYIGAYKYADGKLLCTGYTGLDRYVYALIMSEGQVRGFDYNTGELLDLKTAALILSYDKSSLAPGETAVLQFSYDSSASSSVDAELCVRTNEDDSYCSFICAIDKAPSFAFNTTTVDFGDVIAGFSSTKQVVLENTGCARFVVDDIKISSSSVSCNRNSSLSSDSKYVFDITYTPADEEDVLNEEISFLLESYSSSATATLSISGKGIPSPVISIEESEITITDPISCGEDLSLKLNVTNSATTPLEYSIASGKSNTALVITDGVDTSGEGANTIAAIKKFYSSFSYSTFSSGTAESLETALAGCGVVIIPEIENNTSAYSTYAPVLKSFVKDGGRVVICGAGNATRLNSTGLLDVTGIYSYDGYSVKITDANEITEGVDVFYASNATYAISESTLTADVSYNSYIVVGHKSMGDGMVVYIAGDFYEYDDSNARVIANAAKIAPQKLASGTLAQGSEAVDIKLSTENKPEGEKKVILVVTSNDANNSHIEIPVTFTLQSAAKVVASENALEFSDTMAGRSEDLTISLSNVGCADLTVNDYSVTGDAFSVSSMPSAIAPGETSAVAVTFAPSAKGDHSGSLVIETNAGDITVALSGKALPIPEMSLSSSSFTVDEVLSCDDKVTVSFPVENSGEGDLNIRLKHWVINSFVDLNLSPLKKLMSSFAHISDDGDSNHINDGYNDMYDNGNYLNTNYESGFIYTNGSIVEGGAMGANGSYFTKFDNGMFFMAAELDGVTDFSITGNLGADGNGTQVGYEFKVAGYKAFCTSTHNTYDGRINHIILVPDIDGVSHSFLQNTSDEKHVVSGLKNTDKLVYLLYCSDGENETEENLEKVATGLANLLGDPSDIHYVIKPGKTAILQHSVTSDGKQEGDYVDVVKLLSNDPLNSLVSVNVNYTVGKTSTISTTSSKVDFGSVAVGTSAKKALPITVEGCAGATITDVIVAAGFYDAFYFDNVPSFIDAGDEAIVYAVFLPSDTKDYSSSFIVKSTAGDITFTVSGSGVASPSASIENRTITNTTPFGCGDEASASFEISNSGSLDVQYSVLDNSDKALLIVDGTSYTNAVINCIKANMPYFNYEIFNVKSSGESLSDLLKDKSVAILLPMCDGGNYDYYSNIASELKSFISDGGRAVLCGSYYTDHFDALDLLNVTSLNFYNNNKYIYDFADGKYTEGVASIRLYDYSFVISESTLTADVVYNDKILVGHKAMGKGEIVYVGFNCNSYNSNTSQLYANAIGNTFGNKIASGSLSEGKSATVNVALLAEGIPAGSHSKTVYAVTNDPQNKVIALTCNYSIASSQPVVDISASSVSFGNQVIGYKSAEQTITLSNTGCADLEITEVSKSEGFDDVFAISDIPTSVATGESADITFSFTPSVKGSYEGTLTLSTNADDIVISLSGNAIKPVAVVEQTTFDISEALTCGNTIATVSVPIKNEGDYELSIGTGFRFQEMASADFSAISSLIPGQYMFTLDQGAEGNHIGDGDDDMYDDGNYLSTDKVSQFYYTNGAIATGGAMGANGSYFTSFNNGIFFMGAELDGVSYFQISGGLGADGDGSRVGYVFDLGSYKAFCTSTLSTGDPTVNQIIIVPAADGLSHNFSTDTNNDYHKVSGLENVNKLYYVLFATDEDTNASEKTVRAVAKAVVESILYEEITSIAAGSAEDVEISIDATGEAEGDNTKTVTLRTNDVDNASLDITVNHTVDYSSNGKSIEASVTDVKFPDIKAKEYSYKKVVITNTGCVDITVNAPVSSSSEFSTDMDSPKTLSVGEEYALYIFFEPEAAGEYSGTITISTDNDDVDFIINVEGVCVGDKAVAAYTTTPEGHYYEGDVIDIEVLFNAPVVVDEESTEMPYIELNTGAIAKYAGVSGNIIKFEYTVGADEVADILEFSSLEIMGNFALLNKDNDNAITDVTLPNKLSDNSILVIGERKVIDSISSDEIKVAVAVYPNPATDFIVVELSQEVSGKIEIYNINGSMVLVDNYVGKKQTVNVGGLASGMYIVRVVTNDKVFVKQVLKK